MTTERFEPIRIPRMDELLSEKGLRHFQREPWMNPQIGMVDERVIGDRLPYRFLVARDEWERIFAPLVPDGTHLEYGGFPVEPDDSLSPGSIVLVEDVR